MEVESRSKFTAADYQDRARQCVRMARDMTDAANKMVLLEMARVWIKLAQALEGPPEPSAE